MSTAAPAVTSLRTDALLRASLNPDPETAVASVLQELMAGDVDWTDLIGTALCHHVVPALLRPFTDPRSAGVVPPEIAAAVVTYCDGARARNEHLAQELCDVLAVLEAEGIPAIPFKGVVLAELLYADLGQRPAGDLDVLIGARDIARVRACLEARGYTDVYEARAAMTAVQRRVFERYQCEYELARERDGVLVEPHWAFAPRWLAIDVDYDALFTRSRPALLQGRPVRVHPVEDLLLALCIHGSKHEWERLSWIRDVARLAGATRDLDYGLALERARAYDCTRILLLGLDVARVVAGATLPRRILDEIQKEPAIAQMTEHVQHVLVNARPEVENLWPSLYGMRLHDGVLNRLRYLAGISLPPRPVHIELVALPALTSALYFPLRWTADYIARPAWLLARLALHGRRR